MLVTDLLGVAASRPATVRLPPGRPVELPGGGSCFVTEAAGPAGAPTVVLVHGLMATGGLNWFPSLDRLSREFRVLALDLRGHGRSAVPGRPFRIDDAADDVVAVADALGVGRFIVVGYSLGGPVAQTVWRRHPDRVAGMVLCATSRNFGGGGAERAFYAAVAGGLSGWRAAGRLPGPWRAGGRPDVDGWADVGGEWPAAADPVPGEAGPTPASGLLVTWAAGELGRNRLDTVAQALRELGRFSSHSWIGEVDVPTAVVVTALDRLVSPGRQLKLARAIPGATVHPVPAGHAACVIGARHFVPVLAEACRSVTARAGLVATA